MQKLTGLLLLAGTILFFAGEGRAVSDFSIVGDPQAAIPLVAADPGGWRNTIMIWAAGAVVVAAGLAVFARQAQTISHNRPTRIAAYVGAALVALGALLWVGLAYYRIVLPPEELFSRDTQSRINTVGAVYWLLTRIGLVVTGVVLLRTGYPKWLGVTVILVSALLLIPVPALTYFITLFLGLLLLVLRSRSPQLPARGA